MHAKRKLIRFDLLGELANKHHDGVPIARLIRDYKLDVSLPHLSKMIQYHALGVANESLDPDWLDPDGDSVQECSDVFKYNGLFPFGEWVIK